MGRDPERESNMCIDGEVKHIIASEDSSTERDWDLGAFLQLDWESLG